MKTLNIQLYDFIDLLYNWILVDILVDSTVQDTFHYSCPKYNYYYRLMKILKNKRSLSRALENVDYVKEKKKACKYLKNFQESHTKKAALCFFVSSKFRNTKSYKFTSIKYDYLYFLWKSIVHSFSRCKMGFLSSARYPTH